MPVYEYERRDGTRFEIRQSFSEEPLTTDPDTRQEVHRVLSAPSIIYRGTGSYGTSYRSRPRESEASEG